MHPGWEIYHRAHTCVARDAVAPRAARTVSDPGPAVIQAKRSRSKYRLQLLMGRGCGLATTGRSRRHTYHQSDGRGDDRLAVRTRTPAERARHVLSIPDDCHHRHGKLKLARLLGTPETDGGSHPEPSRSRETRRPHLLALLLRTEQHRARGKPNILAPSRPCSTKRGQLGHPDTVVHNKDDAAHLGTSVCC